MGLFLVYLFNSTICLTGFYCFNKWLFSRETFHTFNRTMWLCVMVLSLLLPLMTWGGFYSFFASDIPVNITPTGSIPFNYSALPVQTNDAIYVTVKYLFIAYLLFAAIFGVRFFLSYWGILKTVLSKREKSMCVADDVMYVALFEQCKCDIGLNREVNLLLHDEKISPFSWMNHVVISRTDVRKDGREILIHELSHVKYRHSWDILFVDLLIVFQWFNPIAWLYKQSLLQTHEYMADEAVLNAGVNSKLYQLLLIKKTADKCCCHSMINSLNQSKLKNRIIMMVKEKSNSWRMARCLYLLPLASLTVSLFAMPKVSDQFDEISSVAFQQAPTDSLVVGSTSDKNPPIYFVDGKEFKGDISTISSDVIKSISVLKDQNAIDIYGEKGKNGVVLIKTKKAYGAAKVDVRGFDNKNKPLVFVDNKEYKDDISTISPDSIESVSVFKGESAIEKYGKKGKNGVVLVTTKKR